MYECGVSQEEGERSWPDRETSIYKGEEKQGLPPISLKRVEILSAHLLDSCRGIAYVCHLDIMMRG